MTVTITTAYIILLPAVGPWVGISDGDAVGAVGEIEVKEEEEDEQEEEGSG